MIPLFKRHVIVAAAAVALVLPQAADATPTLQQGVSCAFQFEVTIDMEHGTLAPGDVLLGALTFTLGPGEERGDTVHHKATGAIKVSHPDHGKISGTISYVHITRSPYVADYVSVGALDTKGDLGGEGLNFDPMLISLYGPRGMLSNSNLVMTDAVWNAFGKRRVFQYHSPRADRALLFQVGPMTGTCTR